ncbi:hypothetical protein DSECCO2_277770 [anaerobic digester metagenome]
MVMKSRVLFIIIVLMIAATGIYFNIQGKERPTEKKSLIAASYFSGFDLGNDKETLYYLTSGTIYENGRRVKGRDKISMGYEDVTRPTYVNSIALDKDGNVYTLARFDHEGKEVEDLVKIPNPFK